MKFGGSLAADARSIQQIARVTLAEALAWDRMLVVISAMAGVTDRLSAATRLAEQKDAQGYRKVVHTIREQHRAIVVAVLNSEAAQASLLRKLDGWLFDALAVCDRVSARHSEAAMLARECDAVMSVGERLMVEIVTALLQQNGLRCALIDSAALIPTDEHFQNANPLPDKLEERADSLLRPVLNAGVVAITSGFIGATLGGAVTTLGRGGSDYTATLLAAALRADEVWMWTRVDGIMSADPLLVPAARVIETLSYDEMRELAYFGVRLLHPRAIEPLLTRPVPLRIRNPFNPEHGGTLVQAQPGTQPLRSVSAVDGLLISTPGIIDLGQFLAQVNQLVGQAATGPVLVVQRQSQAAVAFVVPTSEGPGGVLSVMERLQANLHAARWNIQPVKVIAALGGPPDLARRAKLNTLAQVQGPGAQLISVVAPEEMIGAVRQLHHAMYDARGT